MNMIETIKKYCIEKRRLIQWIMTIFGTVVTILGNFYIVYRATHSDQYDFYLGRTIYRCVFFCIFMGIVFIHIWIPWKKLYQFIFKYRLLLAIGVVIFMSANGLHFSSITMYDSEIQPGEGSEYRLPLFGSPRDIRSDEWLVSTPSKLSTRFSGTGKTNYIPMAMEMDNIVASGLQKGWSMLAKPYDWGYYTGNVTFGLSFQWSFTFVFTFLAAFEFCLILSGRKRWIGVLGGCLITFSAYNMWWSYAIWIFAGMSAIDCFYYTVNVRKLWQRILYGIATAITASCFIVNLYPAWQVPAGYLFLLCLIWIILHYRKRFKLLKGKDWVVISACILFMGSIVAAYMKDYSAYTSMIMNTVYPGERISNGGMALDKLCNYIGDWRLSLYYTGNASELSTVFSLFPIPLVLGLWHLKSKKKDLLITFLTGLSVFLTFYCSIGIPMWLAKATLMTNSIPERAVDILAVTQLLLLLMYIAREKNENKPRFWIIFMIIRLVVLVSAVEFYYAYKGYLGVKNLVVIIDVITVCGTFLVCRGKRLPKRVVAVFLSLGITASGLMVHPLTKGLDAIYSKPLAKEVMNIVQEDPYGKWLTVDVSHVDGFLVACGAPTINSTNTVPNYDMWEILDDEGTYEEAWNRYAHMDVSIGQQNTSVELVNQDYIWLQLNYDDLEKIGVSYIYSKHEIASYGVVHMEEIYHEGECYIYKVTYE